jgi:hypothetical protein
MCCERRDESTQVRALVVLAANGGLSNLLLSGTESVAPRCSRDMGGAYALYLFYCATT